MQLKKTVMVKGKKYLPLSVFLMSKYATSSVIADISNQLKTLEHETTMNRFSGARVSHDLSLLSYFITFYLWFLLLQQISGVFEKKTCTFLAFEPHVLSLLVRQKMYQ